MILFWGGHVFFTALSMSDWDPGRGGATVLRAFKGIGQTLFLMGTFVILVFGGLIFGLTAYLQIGSDFSTSRNFLIIVVLTVAAISRTAISLSQISEEEKEIQLRKNRPILKPWRVPHDLEVTFRAGQCRIPSPQSEPTLGSICYLQEDELYVMCGGPTFHIRNLLEKIESAWISEDCVSLG